MRVWFRCRRRRSPRGGAFGEAAVHRRCRPGDAGHRPAGPVVPVAKAETTGVTAERGSPPTTSTTTMRDEDEREELAKAELAAFRRFTRARRKAGTWRDFTVHGGGTGDGRGC